MKQGKDVTHLTFGNSEEGDFMAPLILAQWVAPPAITSFIIHYPLSERLTGYIFMECCLIEQ
jgi:hypothetical protein